MKKHQARNDRPEPGIEWFWVEMQAAEMAREKAGKHGFAVYCALCLLARKAYSDHKTTIMAGAKTIGEIAGISEDSASRAIQILRQTELLTVVSGEKKRGQKDNSNAYTLHYTKPLPAADSTATSGNPDRCQRHQAKGRKYSSPSGKEYLSSVKGGKSRRRSARNSSAAAGISSSAALPPEKKADEPHSIFNNF